MESKTVQALNKMIEHAEKTMEFTKGMNYDAFRNDERTIDACIMRISQIGEVVKHVDKSAMNKYPNIQWHAMKNLRNKIVHDYDGIQYRFIWRIIERDLSQLIEDLKKIVESEK